MYDAVLERRYREELDEKIVAYLADIKGWPLERALDYYYHSHIAEMIGKGKCGIQYLDYKVLVEMMLETEAIKN